MSTSTKRVRSAETKSSTETNNSRLPSSYSDGISAAIEVAARDWYTQGASLAIRQLAMSGRGFTAEHVVKMCGEPDEPYLLGAAFAAAQRSGVITSVGAVIGSDGAPRRVWWGS